MKTRITLIVLLTLAGLTWPRTLDARQAADAPVVVDPQTEQLIRGALRWLAARQNADGSWHNGPHTPAFTAYAVVAFLTAGELPGEGEHGQVVQRAVDYLIESVGDDGFVRNPRQGGSNMYGHGIVTKVLGEVYGQTQDPRIRPKLDAAVAVILRSQNNRGGWRYHPRPADDDLSVTITQVVALRVAQTSGIDIPQEVLDRALKYVESCQHRQSGGFTYTPRSGGAGLARTAAAVYAFQMLGHYEHPMIGPARDYMFQHHGRDNQWYTYGAFYSAPAMLMIGEEHWPRWYATVHERITKAAQRDGEMVFWRPFDGGTGQNEIWATSVYATILALPYGYVPIYQR